MTKKPPQKLPRAVLDLFIVGVDRSASCRLCGRGCLSRLRSTHEPMHPHCYQKELDNERKRAGEARQPSDVDAAKVADEKSGRVVYDRSHGISRLHLRNVGGGVLTVCAEVEGVWHRVWTINPGFDDRYASDVVTPNDVRRYVIDDDDDDGGTWNRGDGVSHRVKR